MVKDPEVIVLGVVKRDREIKEMVASVAQEVTNVAQVVARVAQERVGGEKEVMKNRVVGKKAVINQNL